MLFAGATLFLGLWSRPIGARIYIQVDQPSEKKFTIAVPDLIRVGDQRGGSWEKELPALLRRDLEIAGLFDLLSLRQLPLEGKVFTPDKINFGAWNLIGAQGLVKGAVTYEEEWVTVELRLFDTALGEQLAGQRYRTKPNEMASVVHHFTDEILRVLTGERGPFSARIAFVGKDRKHKEIFTTDVAGLEVRQLTTGRTICLSPTWDPRGQKIVYTAYDQGYPELRLLEVQSRVVKQLTHLRSLVLSPAWSPNGGEILAASAKEGETDLHLFDLEGNLNKALVPSLGIDVNPSWSPDGSAFVFASERAGRLHLFKSNADGTVVQRLTFVGYHNDKPAWSPRGDKIAFQSRDEGVFDIFIMNADGSMIQRLTADSGDNESPSWAPNGRYIVYSSTGGRRGPHLKVMMADGSNQKVIHRKGYGTHPDWGPWSSQ